MFNVRNLCVAMLAIVSIGFAGNASAKLINSGSAAATTSSLVIPIPGLAKITVGYGGGLDLGVSLFPFLKTTTPIIDLSIGKISIAAAIGPPVPEPETYAMMGLGLGLVALAARRRRSAPSALTQVPA